MGMCAARGGQVTEPPMAGNGRSRRGADWGGRSPRAGKDACRGKVSSPSGAHGAGTRLSTVEAHESPTPKPDSATWWSSGSR